MERKEPIYILDKCFYEVEDLVWYDGPILKQLKDHEDNDYLWLFAVEQDNEEKFAIHLIFQLTEEEMDDFLNNKITQYYVIENKEALLFVEIWDQAYPEMKRIHEQYVPWEYVVAHKWEPPSKDNSYLHY